GLAKAGPSPVKHAGILSALLRAGDPASVHDPPDRPPNGTGWNPQRPDLLGQYRRQHRRGLRFRLCSHRLPCRARHFSGDGNFDACPCRYQSGDGPMVDTKMKRPMTPEVTPRECTRPAWSCGPAPRTRRSGLRASRIKSAGIFSVVFACLGGLQGAVVFDAFSAYHHVQVVDQAGTRTLRFNGSMETRMALANPLQGHFE